jgi:hypothetical protein
VAPLTALAVLLGPPAGSTSKQWFHTDERHGIKEEESRRAQGSTGSGVCSKAVHRGGQEEHGPAAEPGRLN